MKFITLTIISFFVSMQLIGQSISGGIDCKNQEWEKIIYLSEVSSISQFFSGTNENVVDSCRIENGKFIFKKVLPKTLYRLSVFKLNSSPCSLLQND